MQKISLFHLFIFEIDPILTHTQQNFKSVLIFINLYLYIKNLAISSICSRDIVDLKILLSDLPRTFYPISKEADFLQVWALHSSIANNSNFHYKPNLEKLMTKSLNKFKKAYFWPILDTLFQF